MEVVLVPLLAAYFVAISFMLAPTSSHQLDIHVQDQHSLEKAAGDDHRAKFTILPSLPRKLQLNQELKVMKNSPHKYNSVFPPKESIEPPSGTKIHEDEEDKKQGTWKEGFDEDIGPNKSEYLSMDYTWVRNKRPIHN